jgi:hypothetical protein
MHEIGNQIEGVFWIAIAGIVAVAGLRSHCGRRRLLAGIAAGLFVLFGISDFVEAQTGAWWEPVWLLVWKGLCLGGFLVCLVSYKRICAKPKSTEKETTPDNQR